MASMLITIGSDTARVEFLFSSTRALVLVGWLRPIRGPRDGSLRQLRDAEDRDEGPLTPRPVPHANGCL